MAPVPPSWFKQRQGNMEAAGDNMYRLTAPNLDPHFILIRPADSGWQAALRKQAEGPDIDATVRAYATPPDAWQAAFELFRNHAVV